MEPIITKHKGATYIDNDSKLLQSDRGGLSDTEYEQIVAVKNSQITSLTGEVNSLTQANQNLEAAAHKPENIATIEALEAKLTAANVGRIYCYTGETTANYTQGELYQVEEVTV